MEHLYPRHLPSQPRASRVYCPEKNLRKQLSQCHQLGDLWLWPCFSVDFTAVWKSGFCNIQLPPRQRACRCCPLPVCGVPEGGLLPGSGKVFSGHRKGHPPLSRAQSLLQGWTRGRPFQIKAGGSPWKSSRKGSFFNDSVWHTSLWK